MWLAAVISSLLLAHISSQFSEGHMPKLPKRIWKNVYKCLSHSSKFCETICDSVNNTDVEEKFHNLLSCRAQFNNVSRAAVRSCNTARNTDKCVMYEDTLDGFAVSKKITDPQLITVWNCMNSHCGNLDACTSICLPTTNQTDSLRHEFASCYKAKIKSAKAKMRECFAREANV